jgi:hypothetical protein
MDKRVKIKVTVDNVVTTEIDQVMPVAEVNAFKKPYESCVSENGEKISTEINITNP